MTESVPWTAEGSDLARAFLARAKSRRPAAGRPGGSRLPRETAAAVRRGIPSDTGWSGPADDERDPQTVAATVSRLVAEHGWGEHLRVHGVLARWDQIVGPDVAAQCRPERYAETELSVTAATTAWATQLRMLAPTLVRRLNEELGDGTVTRIVVRGPAAPSWTKGYRRVAGRGPRDTYG